MRLAVVPGITINTPLPNVPSATFSPCMMTSSFPTSSISKTPSFNKTFATNRSFCGAGNGGWFASGKGGKQRAPPGKAPAGTAEAVGDWAVGGKGWAGGGNG